MASVAHWRRLVNEQLLENPLLAQFFAAPFIRQCCREVGHHWRDSFWSPATTLLTFLLQVLGDAKTLRAAVASLRSQLVVRRARSLPSADPAAYCQARQRLPLGVVQRLSGQVGQEVRRRVPDKQRWLGRSVWVVDGSSVSMPDTPELQQAFPQPAGQQPGCGFPAAQLVAVFCWATGTVRDWVLDSCRPHELPLFRRLWDQLEPGSVVLADRAYCAYVDLVRLQQRGVDAVLRLHQRRPADFRRGRRLGPDDRRVTWSRPERWRASCGLTREEFAQLPETLALRLVRIAGLPRGFRCRTIVVATTLLDPVAVPAEALRALYRDRWTVELNLRDLKTSLQMEILRGESVDVVRKEVAMHFLAYNLIRLLMWQAAQAAGRRLHRLSFAGTLHRLRLMLPLSLGATERSVQVALVADLLWCIAHDVVPDRPNRYEPRRVKRRPKEYSRLNRPRRWFHQHLDHSGR